MSILLAFLVVLGIIVSGSLAVLFLALAIRTALCSPHEYQIARARVGGIKDVLNGGADIKEFSRSLDYSNGLAAKKDKDGRWVWIPQRRLSRIGISHR